jgi:hypothetical protein
MHILIYYKLSIFKKLGKIQFGSLAHLGQGVTLITQLKNGRSEPNPNNKINYICVKKYGRPEFVGSMELG